MRLKFLLVGALLCTLLFVLLGVPSCVRGDIVNFVDLRPIDDGDKTQWTASGLHYDDVDEESCDGDGSYLRVPKNYAGVKRDLFHIENCSFAVDATILNVTVWYWMRGTSTTSFRGRGICKSYGTEYTKGSLQSFGTSYSNDSLTWNVNPYTGSAWSREEVDCLQVGVEGVRGIFGFPPQFDETRCSMVFCRVFYSEASGGDSVCPMFGSIEYNCSDGGCVCLFSCLWEDDVGLSGFIFEWNGSGSWVNDTWVGFGGNPDWANVSKTLPVCKVVVGFGWWGNDTSDNWNFTGVQSFIVVVSEGEGGEEAGVPFPVILGGALCVIVGGLWLLRRFKW